MKFIFELCARSTNEEAEIKHDSLILFLKQINKPWGIENNISVPFPGFGKEITAICILNKFIGKGIKCLISYRYRNMLRNDPSCDDKIYYEFDLKKVDYKELVTDLFPKYILAFNSYRARILPEELIYLDFNKSRNKNLRETIIRFYPVMFLDNELCARAIKMSPVTVYEKLKGVVEKVELIGTGIFIIASFNALSIDDCNKFDTTIRALLFPTESGTAGSAFSY